MTTQGNYTREDILTQTEAWAEAIQHLQQQEEAIKRITQEDAFEEVIFTGCGSTYYLSLAAAALLRELTGKPASGLPASELWLSHQNHYLAGKKTLLIAVSRSGETSETLQAIEVFRASKRGRLITVVCNPGSPMTMLGDLNLVFPSAMEISVAQTKAFSTLFLVTTGLCGIWSRDMGWFEQLMHLPAAGKQIIDTYPAMAGEYGRETSIDRIYFLGSGCRFGLACELSLKMKEMALTHSEAFHFMEFRHGPKAMVNQNTLVVGLVSERNQKSEQAVLNDVAQLEGKILSAGEKEADIIFQSNVKEVYRNTLYLPFGQMLAYERSIAKGLDPDHPVNLEAVVKLSEA
jgi:glucosamine--fructose-6-phosphate aminotransferase (isomerizing)